jgi:hypothetical protein
MRNVIIKSILLIAVVLQFEGKLIAQATNKIDSVGNVGIGTTSPTDKLTVEGQIKSGAILMTGWSQSPYSNSTWLRGASGVGVFLTNENVSRWAGIQADGSFDVSSGKLFVHTTTGYVGLGSKTPTQQLFVNNGSKTNSLYVGAGSDFSDRSGNGDNIYIRQPLRTNGGWWGVHMALQGPLSGHTADFNPIRYMTDENNDGYEDYLRFQVDKYGGGFFGGNVGIGTASPQYLLHLNGDNPVIKLSSTGSQSYAALRGNNDSWLFGYHGTTEYEDISIGTQDGTGQRTLTLAAGGIARLRVLANGSIGIGTLQPSEKLSVNGNIRAKKVIVSQTGWPDYVFDPAYKLKPLSELAAFIQKHQHLPDMPSAKEVEQKGISVGDNQALLLKKIEELTLYIIKMGQENEQIKRQLQNQANEIKQLKNE